jgi:hypothetical protein
MVQVWLKNGRKYTNMPKLTDSDAFSLSWWVWWRSLQPECRLLEDGTLGQDVPDTNEAWEKVCRGGRNGFVIIVLTLSWWITAFDGKVEDEDLLCAVADVTWVLGCMVQSLKASGGEKRGLEEENDDGPVAKKR